MGAASSLFHQALELLAKATQFDELGCAGHWLSCLFALVMQATSSLDAESEAKVQEALDRVASGRTVLVVAHRLSTVQSASEVVVISHGGIAERGTHAELLHKGADWTGLRGQLQRLLIAGPWNVAPPDPPMSRFHSQV